MSCRPFRSFFEAATGLRTGPHEYQTNLAECGRLPDILAVPTGCGKTAAAVLSWVWRRRECPDDDIRRRTPRRLIYCLPMRSLVEQVRTEVIRWFANLGWLQLGSQPLPDSYRPNWPRDEVPVFQLIPTSGRRSPEAAISYKRRSTKGEGYLRTPIGWTTRYRQRSFVPSLLVVKRPRQSGAHGSQ